MSDQAMYPYLLQPKETAAIWGGDALVTKYHKAGDPTAKLGESWECWDENRVTNGALAGSTLGELRDKLGPALLGNINADRIFPILTKIIDARDWLSVQVHPDDAYARRVEHQPNGKTECWYIFSAEPDSELVLGWLHDTTREEYERRVADGTLGDLLRRVPVHPGDAFYLPSGTLHAIGKGIVLFETQQASDLTYRIFDWNRIGADGKPRELHVQKAADVLDYHAGKSGAVTPVSYHFEGLDRTALIADRHFLVEHVVANNEPASIATHNRPLIFMALASPLEVSANNVAVTLQPYQTAIVPAGVEWCTVYAPQGKSDFMLVTPPEHQETIAVRLLAAGVPQEQIDHFVLQFA